MHLPISEVLTLAEHVFRQEQFEASALNDELRNDFLTSLFDSEYPRLPGRVWTSDQLEDRRQRVETALTNLGVKNAQQLSEDYFGRLEGVVGELGGQAVPNNWPDAPNSATWADWLVEGSDLASRIERLIPLIQDYETKRSRITRRSTRFLESVNSFIRGQREGTQATARVRIVGRTP